MFYVITTKRMANLRSTGVKQYRRTCVKKIEIKIGKDRYLLGLKTRNQIKVISVHWQKLLQNKTVNKKNDSNKNCKIRKYQAAGRLCKLKI